MPHWLTLSSTLVTALGAIVTAVATIFLVKVTRVLATATNKMADAGARPQIVATIEPNRWAMNHADMVVVNSGNATAFDIEIKFDPPLREKLSGDQNLKAPFEKISVLNPGQKLVSHISEFGPLLNKKFLVTVAWRRDPATDEQDNLIYTINTDFEGIARLGSEPIIQIAEQIKRLREDWQNVPGGSRRIHVDVFSSRDREEERRQIEARYANRRQSS